MTGPSIYVACLAAYQSGRLHGAWIDATQAVAKITAEIQEMLDASPEKRTCQWCGAELLDRGGSRWDRDCTSDQHWVGHAEEWAIHDYEGFCGLRIGEHKPLDDVVAIAAGIATNGAAFAAWLSYDDSRDPHNTDAFNEAYRGEWGCMRDFANHHAEETGLYEIVEQAASPYVIVDIDALARDLCVELCTAPTEAQGIYVFDPRA